MSEFDVFLAHNSLDKPLIQKIYDELQKRGIKPWLDEVEICPGDNFQFMIRKAIKAARTAAICIGQNELGKWQELETQTFVSLAVQQSVRIIPVLLPGVEKIPESAFALDNFHAVKFGETLNNQQAFDLLEWGITGKKPELPWKISGLEDPSPEPEKICQEFDPTKILFIKNVKDPSGCWAYRLKGVREDKAPVFELMWRSSAHGSGSPKAGDLMILHQQAKVTHVVEFLDDEVRKMDFGFLRWVKAVWIPRQQDWYQLPHQKEILGFSPKYSDGNTHDFRSPNFSTFRNAWTSLSDFQHYVADELKKLDNI
ncbi:toll/interleukin-1 receptor domain-containing protein [Almyronema epifaneia]|uniref:Toll/interleukin-1 receptor domain-containing protein n=1 Tax=Almyronema epifaneia S1 TaxID=2991925 RepID=A0ABW6IJK7_9CYAN